MTKINNTQVIQETNNEAVELIVAYKRGTYKKEDRICIVCDSIFKGTKKAKFCSNKCKQKDKYKRLKEAIYA
jgi:hypothetical protein